ncbi:restriction endonuclease subunit S [Nocardiopsis sp. CT-R113]|uniref:Restriction endonuclease subunit S n=1 Tax=Nocardiopsis codii TaxID=3065942 RepID=A0ABU7KB16_9ACTN|nr:restriction endonuclease subunit S [Nocardiopsis sp. CT-R113]MEE2038757.1 restriction endonuclease subunit S [Nocardiopsis sp. CT-R113]
MTRTSLPLRRLFKIFNGGTPTASEENWGGSIPWATPVDLANGAIGVSETQRTLTQVGVKSSSSVVPRGSILLSTRAPIGYTAIAEIPIAFNQGCRALVPLGESDVRFFRYQLEARKNDLRAAGMGTTFSELSSGALADFEVECPSFSEQRIIADFLDIEVSRLEALVSASERIRALLNDKRAELIYSEALGSRVRGRHKDVALGWVSGVPESWEVVPLKYIARLGTGHTPSRTNSKYWENCDIPWISLFDVGRMRDPRQEVIGSTTQMISQLGLDGSSAVLHPAGTVVLSRTASVGFSTIMGKEMAVSQHFVTWTCGDRINPTYLLYLLRSMKQYFESVQVGTTNVTVFMPDLYSIRVPLPPILTQEEIVNEIQSRVGEIDHLACKVDRKISLLKERKHALITAAVTGQIDVTTARGADLS